MWILEVRVFLFMFGRFSLDDFVGLGYCEVLFLVCVLR